MARAALQSRTRRPTLRDPEWWTAIAVDLLDWKPASLAKDVAKLLKTEQQDLAQELRTLSHAFRAFR